MATAKHDGVQFAYTETSPPAANGGAAGELLFIHGWGGHRGFLRPQQEFFAANYRTVAMDLRGHGRSDGPTGDYSISQLASDALWLSDYLQLSAPVVIGHDLGAAVAVELACQAPRRVRAVVALDGPLAVSEESEHTTRSISSGLQTAHYVEALRYVAERTMFLPTDDPDVRDWVLGEMRQVPQHVLIDAALAHAQWDADSAIRNCSVPSYYIASANTPADLHRLIQLSPITTLGMTPEVGHFHQLLAPRRINALIESFLVGLAERPPGSASSPLTPDAVSSAVPSLSALSAMPVVQPLELPAVPPLPHMSLRLPTAPSSPPPLVI